MWKPIRKPAFFPDVIDVQAADAQAIMKQLKYVRPGDIVIPADATAVTSASPLCVSRRKDRKTRFTSESLRKMQCSPVKMVI